VIDLHTHLIPGVDDGSPTLENSLRVLERLRQEGVTEVACTPHLEASRAAVAPITEYRTLLVSLQQGAPDGMRLHPGFEIMLDRPGCDLTLPGLSLGSSKAVLVEFPRVPLTPDSTDELMRLRASGVVPVIAHPERYSGITIEKLHIWRDFGVIVQGDALMLLQAGPKAEFSRRMLTEGVVDILASDNHGDRRSLGLVRLWLREVGGERQGRILTEVNPARVLADEMLDRVPPLKERRGIWERLRSLFSRQPSDS
jgi:protein-tyrosine phosphatase